MNVMDQNTTKTNNTEKEGMAKTSLGRKWNKGISREAYTRREDAVWRPN